MVIQRGLTVYAQYQIRMQPTFMLEKCLIWLEHQPEANEYNVCTLRKLQALAARVQSL